MTRFCSGFILLLCVQITLCVALVCTGSCVSFDLQVSRKNKLQFPLLFHYMYDLIFKNLTVLLCVPTGCTEEKDHDFVMTYFLHLTSNTLGNRHPNGYSISN